MTDDFKTRYCTAFRGSRQIASGAIEQVALKLRAMASDGHARGVLVFDDVTAQPIDLDLRGTEEQVLQRLTPPLAAVASSAVHAPDLSLSAADLSFPASDRAESAAPGRPGRPKLGVVAREVTLLPRHWDWLSRQSGGASVALRKLVDEARRISAGQDIIRQSQEAAYRFMSATAGNEKGFEEATRALFAADERQFDAATATWPADIRRFGKELAAPCLDPRD